MAKSAFNYMPMGEQGLRDIYKWIDNFVSENSNIAEKIILGKSEDEKWDVPAIIVTNKAVPQEQKQIAIVTLARHGQEKGTRVVGPEILNYLASSDAEEIREKQTVVVVPIVNPVGVVLDEFHSSLFGITDHEKKIFGKLCSLFTPDMMIDYHSLGKVEGEKFDLGDMEVIVPANCTKWGMDEQIYQHVSDKLKEAAAKEGWPYEVHTLEELNLYYFGDPKTGKLPHKYMEEKVFLLHIQNTYEHYDTFSNGINYTNYTNGPAYMKWHSLVFGVETNHWSIGVKDGLAESGMIITKELLKLGNSRFSWEKYEGYPTNIIVGDFRISVRSTGKMPAERRVSREKIWKERNNFNILKREMLKDPKVTLAQIGYIGEDLPLEFEFCLRLRQNKIKEVLVNDQNVDFETFTDNCSTFLVIPMNIKKPGVSKIEVVHNAFKEN